MEVAAVLDPALVFTWVLSKCLEIKISLRTVAIKNEIRVPKLELNDVLLKFERSFKSVYNLSNTFYWRNLSIVLAWFSMPLKFINFMWSKVYWKLEELSVILKSYHYCYCCWIQLVLAKVLYLFYNLHKVNCGLTVPKFLYLDKVFWSELAVGDNFWAYKKNNFLAIAK